jgi:hypothetical protein
MLTPEECSLKARTTESETTIIPGSEQSAAGNHEASLELEREEEVLIGFLLSRGVLEVALGKAINMVLSVCSQPGVDVDTNYILAQVRGMHAATEEEGR